MTSRRKFVKSSIAAGIALQLPNIGQSQTRPQKPIFKISLAQWSLNSLLFSGKMDNLEFAPHAKKHGIEAIEYVNQFFMDKAKNSAYLKEMKSIAESEGVKSLLIMCDNEGALGEIEKSARMQTVENHKKWVEAAAYLGCHSIRVNGYSKSNDYFESQKWVADGLHHLCEYGDQHHINVIIENHGGFSSYGPWLMGVMEKASHHRAGTLPDFGNFRIRKNEETGEIISYDSYRGIKEMMPLAEGVSVKTTVWDNNGNNTALDYQKMMKIVLDAGYRGYCGIEHGEKGRVWDSIVEVKEALLIAQNWLQMQYK